MTPLVFESLYRDSWTELGKLLEGIEKGSRQPHQGARLSELYRRSCEHLALARSRAYPIHLIDYLESLTQRAHQLIYRRHDYGILRFKQWALVDFPEQVRAQRWYVLIAALLFVIPLLGAGWATYQDRGFVLHFVDIQTMQSYDEMYAGERELGRARDAETDWAAFGGYIQHNISIGFRCFASGMLAGIGTIYIMIFNGLMIGAIAGYITAQGHIENFYSFVITHGAFELTGLVLAGAAGLRLGHALVAPGRRTRVEALKHHAADAVVVMYGVFAMLLIAAFIEAFWSSSRWIGPHVKYASGTLCWLAVFAYFIWQGRPRHAR